MVGVTEEPQLEIYQVAESVHHHNQIIPEKTIMQTTDYVYVYLCVCLCINLHVCACTCLMCLCVCVCMCTCLYLVCVCLCTCLCAVCVFVYMCVPACLHVCKHMHVFVNSENIILNTSITYAMTVSSHNISSVIKKKVELKWENKIMMEVMCF